MAWTSTIVYALFLIGASIACPTGAEASGIAAKTGAVKDRLGCAERSARQRAVYSAAAASSAGSSASVLISKSGLPGSRSRRWP